MRHRSPAAIAVVALLSLPLLLSGAPAGATTTTPAGTAAQVKAAVTKSITISSIPSDLTPALSLFSSSKAAGQTDGGSLMHKCDPHQNPAQLYHPVACFGGNLHSSKTIVLLGDSNAGNWSPALAIGLARSPYRLAVFWYPGCGPAAIHYTHVTDHNYPTQCNRWHANLPGAIRALHPVAIVTVAAAWRENTGTGGAQWVAGMKKMFEQATLGSPSTVRIVLGTSPSFRWKVPACLMANADPQNCGEADTAGSSYGGYLAQDELIAQTSDATLIPTYPWLCYDGTCSPVVSHFLVYVDSDHISTAYSQFLSKVVTRAVVKVVLAAS